MKKIIIAFLLTFGVVNATIVDDGYSWVRPDTVLNGNTFQYTDYLFIRVDRTVKIVLTHCFWVRTIQKTINHTKCTLVITPDKPMLLPVRYSPDPWVIFQIYWIDSIQPDSMYRYVKGELIEKRKLLYDYNNFGQIYTYPIIDSHTIIFHFKPDSMPVKSEVISYRKRERERAISNIKYYYDVRGRKINVIGRNNRYFARKTKIIRK